MKWYAPKDCAFKGFSHFFTSRTSKVIVFLNDPARNKNLIWLVKTHTSPVRDASLGIISNNISELTKWKQIRKETSVCCLLVIIERKRMGLGSK